MNTSSAQIRVQTISFLPQTARRPQNVQMNSRRTITLGPLADALCRSHGREITEGELDEARRRLDQILDVLAAVEERKRTANPLDTGAPQADNGRLAEEPYH